MSFRIIVCVILALIVSPRAEASKIKVWQQYASNQFEKAKFQQAVVSSEGTLRLSRQLRPLAALEAANIWAIVEDPKGNLYVGTGDDGKIYKVTTDGKVSVLYTSTDSQILSLALAGDGTLFAGTGPTGKIIRITTDLKTSIFADKLGSYVWCLALAPDSSLYAGTGPQGKIYRLGADGKASSFYETKQDHILCLALDSKGQLYAGTDKGGLVYRIDPASRKGFVLFHTQQSEVRALHLTASEIYVGTSAPVSRRGNGIAALKIDDTRPSSPPPSLSGENSVYRVAFDGTAREIFRDKSLILDILRQRKRLLVATGMQGQLFEIDEATRESSEIARLDHGAIQTLLPRRDGSVILGTSDPGKLYVLESSFAVHGTILSDILDAKLPSRWGTLTWLAQTPAGTKASLALRSGNVAEPDATWSDWSDEQIENSGAIAKAPTARYCQYRVTLSSDRPNITPEVKHIALRYQSTNQAPEVTSLEVPDLATTNLDNPRKLKLRWNATDPNEDELSYQLFFRKEGWKDWLLLEENLEKKEFEWDTTGVPSGWYQLKVVASDRHDNAPESTLSAERISPLIPISQTPPTVMIKASVESDRQIFEATATDPYVRLIEASYAVNGKRWINVFPTDGLFDSKTETFRFQIDGLKGGSYVVVLRVRDAAGNYGSADVMIRVVAKE